MSDAPKRKRESERWEIERGYILRYLCELGLDAPATLKTLQRYLDDLGYPCSVEKMDFHLRYLAEKGFVTLDVFGREVGQEKAAIRSVKVTTKGVDLIDRRRSDDIGIQLV